MGTVASQITSLTIVYSTIYSGEDERKYQSSASLAFVRVIHRWPVNSPHKGPGNAENVSIWSRRHGSSMLVKGPWFENVAQKSTNSHSKGYAKIINELKVTRELWAV